MTNKTPNEAMIVKCCCYRCCRPAIDWLALGIVRNRAKKRYMREEERLFKVFLKEDLAIPLCAHHKSVFESWRREITEE
jgi:hypothetical protein